jgi:glyoxylase-like metal-dependent hydrolase (beta-lactamase superfamily II)
MRYKATFLHAGRLLLDGGGMFGLIPRVVWSRSVPTDERNRIELAHNCILLESLAPDPELGRPRRVLIEAGTGDKLDPKMADVFGLDGRTIETALAEKNVAPESIDSVIVSHLHFDHAGGLTRRVRPGETPDWTASAPLDRSGDADAVKLTFPNAEVIVQEREWLDAIANDSVMTRTYYRDHLEPLRPRLRLVDSQRPFPIGLRPHRDELPRIPLEQRTTRVLPGIFVFLVPGHTWGQQAILFHDEHGAPHVFTPDVMPTAWHSGSAYSLAYDVEPYTSMVSRHWLLREASERAWTLVLDHEPRTPRVRVRANDKHWFDLTPVDA